MKVGRFYLWHGIPQRVLQPGYDAGQVRLEVLLLGQRVHVADDLGGHLAGLGRTVLERPLNDGHDEGEGRGVDGVHKLGVEQGVERG